MEAAVLHFHHRTNVPVQWGSRATAAKVSWEGGGGTVWEGGRGAEARKVRKLL